MIEPPWMFLRLGLETGAHHGPADEVRLAALDSTTTADYQAFLVAVYGFEAPAELSLLRTRGLEDDVLRERLKTGRLRRDLEMLGMTANDIAGIPVASTVRIESVAQALGWLFVLERQTLLSGLIRRHLLRTLPAVAGAVSYLDAYGDTPGARFRQLGTQLGSYAQRYAPGSIAAGANEAFRAQRVWYQSGPPTMRAQAIEQLQRTREETRIEASTDPALG